MAADQVRLKNGTTVELVALSDDNRRISWSARNGSPLKEWVRARPNEPVKPKSGEPAAFRTLVFRLTGAFETLKDPRVVTEFSRKDLNDNGAVLDGELPEKDGIRQMLYGCTLPSSPGVSKVTIKVKVAAGPWRTKSSATIANGTVTQSTAGFKPTVRVETPKSQGSWDHPKEHLVFRVGLPKGLTKYGFRFVAFDKRGKELPGSGGSWRADMTGPAMWATKTDDLKDVARFELQTREFQTATFKDVVVTPRE